MHRRLTCCLALLAAVVAVTPAPAGVTFKKHVISREYEAEACAAADIDRDGKLDIIAGENWYQAPDWKPHKFRDVPLDGGYRTVRLDEPYDVNRDGWPDLLTVRRDGWFGWLENPQGKPGPWTAHRAGQMLQSEGTIILRDGPLFLGLHTDFPGTLGLYSVRGLRLAPQHANAAPLPHDRAAHGLGVGDIDRDGQDDLISQIGWYSTPSNLQPDGPLAFHPFDRGQTHHPIVYDFDGDGDNDLAAVSPHDYGLWWWEQTGDPTQAGNWRKHEIDMSISQMHALALADIDGDGDADLVSGKRYRAHDQGDPGIDEPAMLVWYELSRSDGKARFIRHEIDADSGVGYVVTPVDIDGEGDLDILTSSKKGLFLFEQEGRPTLLPLFNGRDLANWTGDMNVWSVRDGVIVGRTEQGLKHNTFLVSRDSYDDFVLTLEVKLIPDSANSGIQFRSRPLPDGECEGYQADIGAGWWGSIYEESARGLLHDGYKGRGQKAVRKDAWNQYVVYAVGDELRVEINGTVCTHLRDSARKTGIIALQVHSGGPTDVQFRNIRLRKR